MVIAVVEVVEPELVAIVIAVAVESQQQKLDHIDHRRLALANCWSHCQLQAGVVVVVVEPAVEVVAAVAAAVVVGKMPAVYL